MPLLQTGITGFDSNTRVPASDVKRAVYAAAQAGRATVGEVTPADGVTPNFHRVGVAFGKRKLVVLFNRHARVVAFADRVGEMEIGRFSEAPADFAAALAGCGFVIGDVAELNRRLTSCDLEALSPAERLQTNYWKPKRIGDIIFNWWD